MSTLIYFELMKKKSNFKQFYWFQTSWPLYINQKDIKILNGGSLFQLNMEASVRDHFNQVKWAHDQYMSNVLKGIRYQKSQTSTSSWQNSHSNSTCALLGLMIRQDHWIPGALHTLSFPELITQTHITSASLADCAIIIRKETVFLFFVFLILSLKLILEIWMLLLFYLCV